MYSTFHSIRHWNRYREIVGILLRHGFGFVFNQLEPEWRSLRRVLGLPARGKVSNLPENLSLHLRLALEELGPTFIKFGQILSTHPDLLPPEYITELSKLQDDVPPVPWRLIREVLIREMGREPENIFLEINSEPIASASLAQVYTAILSDNQEVVIKVQRPGIVEIIDADLDILSSLAIRAQSMPLGKIYDFVSIADEFAFTLRNELDYRQEGRNAERFHENFVNESHLYIPKVFWEYSSQHAIVLERIHGIKINDIPALDSAGYNRHQIALNSIRVIIKEVLEDGFFHADAHPGNYSVMPGEVIGAMDFGMVGYLSNQDRRELIRLYLAAVASDADGIVDQFVRMGAVDVEFDRNGLRHDIDRLLHKYYAIPLKDVHISKIVEEVMPVAFRHHIHFPNNLWLLGKTLAMMEGIGMELDPDFDMFAVAQPFVKRLAWGITMPDSGWMRDVLLAGTNWAELINRLPRTGNRVLERLERNEPIQLSLKETDRITNKLDKLITRLSLSILIGSFIIGLSFLVPIVSTNKWIHWIILGGLVSVICFGIWFLISFFRSQK
ncbi:MAG: ABC1 kinase family protein [Flexilinea sp.]